jgi:hypothetical protein
MAKGTPAPGKDNINQQERVLKRNIPLQQDLFKGYSVKEICIPSRGERAMPCRRESLAL